MLRPAPGQKVLASRLVSLSTSFRFVDLLELLILPLVASKLHGMWGLMQTLMATVNEMVSLESESVDELLARLQKEEDSHYDFLRNPVDAELRRVLDEKSGYKFDELAIVDPNFDWYSLLLTGKSICHTARIPSRIRYLGFLTESNKVGGPSVWGDETYDTGLEVEEAKSLPNPEATKNLPLVFGANAAISILCVKVILRIWRNDKRTFVSSLLISRFEGLLLHTVWRWLARICHSKCSN
jgi:hypothetical protein